MQAEKLSIVQIGIIDSFLHIQTTSIIGMFSPTISGGTWCPPEKQLPLFIPPEQCMKLGDFGEGPQPNICGQTQIRSI